MSTRRRGRPRPSRPEPVGLVVEGDAEYHALPLLHREGLVDGVPPLKTRNCRGIGGDVLPAGIARRLLPHVRYLLAARCAKVVACIDRERRAACPPTLAGEVRRELGGLLRRAGVPDAPVAIVVADRAFESWLLADARGLFRRRHLRKPPDFTCFEGRPGRRHRLGKAELGDLLGGSYSEVRDGPSLFRAIDFNVARNHGPGLPGSRSLDKLLRELGA